jgi:protein TonB
MQASNFASADVWPVIARTRRPVIVAAAAVLAAHAVLFTAIWFAHDTPPERPVEVRAITAQLLAPTPAPAAQPAAQPVALRSLPQPKPPKPAPSHAMPKPAPQPVRTVRPTPLPVAPEPTPVPAAAPAPAAPPAPAEPSARPAAPAAPAAREMMDINAPKNVAALSCNLPKPVYPAMSSRRGETGTAYVHFVIGVTGRIESIELQKSSGYDRLDNAALAAMRDSTCQPYVENGRPIRAAHTQPYRFGLEDD